MADISLAWEIPNYFIDRGKRQEDTEFLQSDLAQFQKDPMYQPDISRYNNPTPELSNFFAKVSDDARGREALPVTSKLAEFKSRGWGSDPNFTGEEWTRGLLETPTFNPTGVTPNPRNPVAMKAVSDFTRNAQSEADLTNISNSVLSNQSPQSSTLARFLAEGGEKSTNQLKTLKEIAQYNDEIARARGRQGWINAGGNSPETVTEPRLRTVMSSAPYGVTLDELSKMTDITGVVPKWKTVDTGTGGASGERQVVKFDERTGAEGGRVGDTWTPKVANQTVNVGVKAYESELGKLTANDVMDMRKAAKASRSKLDALNAIEVLAGDLSTGKLTDLGINAAQVGESFGLSLDPNLQAKEASRAIMGRLALEARNPAGGAGMPGAMSDSDRQFLVSTITPSLSQSKDGRKLLINTMRTLEHRSIDVNDKAEAYIKKYGQLDNGFYQQLSVWARNNPLFQKGKK